MEWSKWGAETEPKHNVTLPFTRSSSAHGLHPGAMRNATKASFAHIFQQPHGPRTRCHELAMYVVFESPLQMLSDSPSTICREPEIMDFLAPFQLSGMTQGSRWPHL